MDAEYFEDCQVGDRIVTPGRTITETDVVQFAALTGDWSLLHTNAEYAKGSVFGERIAHGVLILAVGTGLLSRAGPHAMPKHTIAAGGIDKVRFVGPTMIGDTIHAESEVTQVKAIDEERGLITARNRVVNQRGETTLTFTGKMVVRRRPGPEERVDG